MEFNASKSKENKIIDWFLGLVNFVFDGVVDYRDFFPIKKSTNMTTKTTPMIRYG